MTAYHPLGIWMNGESETWQCSRRRFFRFSLKSKRRFVATGLDRVFLCWSEFGDVVGELKKQKTRKRNHYPSPSEGYSSPELRSATMMHRCNRLHRNPYRHMCVCVYVYIYVYTNTCIYMICMYTVYISPDLAASKASSQTKDLNEGAFVISAFLLKTRPSGIRGKMLDCFVDCFAG